MTLPRGERAAFLTLAAITLVLRAVAFLRYRVDADEPQHLHVAWGWTAGLLQYRDVFDNHTPLFHLLTAPILSAVGERDDVILFMRVPMWLLFGVVVASTFIIGTRLYSRRIGAWSALLLALNPTFFLKSLEYRTDNLWNAFWLLALVVITHGKPTPRRALLAGFLLGCALATSMKTSLLVLALAGSAAATAIAFRRRVPAREILIGAAGFVIVPAAIVAYFAARGALPDLMYGVFGFNGLLSSMQTPLRVWVPRIVSLAALPILFRIAWRYKSEVELRFFFGFATALFFLLLFGWWLLISPRDFLAFLPLLIIFFVAFVERRSGKPALVYVAVALVSIFFLWRYTDGFRNQTREFSTMLHQTLLLSQPGEPVMDYKGESIFRPRPFRYPFEYITRNAVKRGLLRDTIPEDVVRAKAYVAQADGPFWPPRAKAFLSANFIDMGRMRAAGKALPRGGAFTIAIPGRYVMIGHNGLVNGLLDGSRYDPEPFSGGRYLAAGEHHFAADGPPQSLAVVWAPAFERGFSPFNLQDREF